MTEHGAAPAPQATSLQIAIDANYGVNPRNGHVDNGGDVYFNVAPKDGCLIHTSPAQAFEGEPSDGYITLQRGNNRLVPAVKDETITYCTCAIGGTCDPFKPTEQGGNTIGVGSGMPGGHRK